ncbi:MFS transporter [Archangium violaceum]|uniref:MFS transporter n=1 Tax=Archangium violaceum TaxID=83451 RepID=UPI002B2A526C|nr:MFS transporter [Archangium gephyra]
MTATLSAVEVHATREVRPGAVLAVVSSAAFLASLDLFIVNVAFEHLGRSFQGVSLADLSWVLNGYAIAYAALLIPLGRLADRFGRKAGFLLGLGLFTAASAACAASPGLWSLVFSRILQAAGAALLTPTSLGLLLNATPPEGRTRAVRIWAAVGSLAAAAGPVAGGLLVELSWQWVFLVNLPVGLVALVAAARIVPDSRDATPGPLPDLLGAGLLGVAVGALSLALDKAQEWGWSDGRTGVSLLVFVVAGGLFWWRSSGHPAPVVEPALLRVRTFAWANLGVFMFSVAFAASLLTGILWMQQVWHYPGLRTGLAVSPGPLMVPVFASVAQRLSRRVGAGWLAAAGCLFCAAGALYSWMGVGAEPNYVTGLLPGWLLTGVGVGLAIPTLLASATVGLPPARSATGSAIVNMSRQVGMALGVSLLVALVGGSTGGDLRAAFGHVWMAAALVSLCAAPLCLGVNTSRATAPSST